MKERWVREWKSKKNLKSGCERVKKMKKKSLKMWKKKLLIYLNIIKKVKKRKVNIDILYVGDFVLIDIDILIVDYVLNN